MPSPALREHLEDERARRTRAPRHPREREDASPAVLRAVWRELVGDERPYDPAIYQQVYQRLLARRHALPLALDSRLPVAGTSAYDLRVPTTDLLAQPDEAARHIAEVEARYPSPAEVQRAIDGWRDAGGC